ncbi:formyltransferase family protein [Campylobacter sp. 9BO]|uniref:formyltransferase family protein n=1 Tax=Campylobacter sp. 9BO TaxID=3424759 RepID=UPI003D328E10
MKIAFLLDKHNNWIEPFVKKYICLKQIGKIFYNSADVRDNDLVFILGYTKLVDDNFLNTNKLNLVIHESDLPTGKGFSPIQWQILDGKNEITFSLFEAQKEIDSGPIYLQRIVKFGGYELFDEIRNIQGVETINLIDDFLKMYPNVVSRKQFGKETIYPRRTKRDDRLDINKTIMEQFNHFRIADNDKYPLWFEINGHKYNLKISRIYNE